MPTDLDFSAVLERMRALPCEGCGRVGEGARCEACIDAEAQRERDAAATRRRRAIEATIPGSYAWATFDAPELAQRVRNSVALRYTRTLVTAPWIVLRGSAGSGKTSLVVALLRAWVGANATGSGAFVGAQKLGMARIQHRAGDGEPALVETATRARLLVLDDLGSERDHRMNAVPDVIFERHAEGRATWLTTGLTDEQLEARYGEGTARRVLERAVVVHCGAPTA
jgi:DNA replication protein DnaC